MLTVNDDQTLVTPSRDSSRASETANSDDSSNSGLTRLESMLRIEWLGQTAASLCWIVSVFTYGISSAGDWLQLAAASCWLLANVAVVATAKAD